MTIANPNANKPTLTMNKVSGSNHAGSRQRNHGNQVNKRPQGFDYDNKRKTIPGSQKALMHEKELKVLKESKSPVTISLVSGVVIYGVVIAVDKFSIKILNRSGHESVYFKHAIESFGIDRRRVEGEGEA